MEKILPGFCFPDIHNQQAMLDYPTTVRKSLIQAKDLSVEEFGMADIALVGGDNISDYPHWNKSCALPKKNFLDLKAKMHACISASTKDSKVLYVAGNNDMILGDIGTDENEPYNTTDFYDVMDGAFGALPEGEKLILTSRGKPNELYWGAFHYVVGGIDFIGINIDPDTAFNSHEGYYSDETLVWVKNKLDEIGLGKIQSLDFKAVGCEHVREVNRASDIFTVFGSESHDGSIGLGNLHNTGEECFFTVISL